MTICPYCKGPLSEEAALPPMRPRWKRIYDAVVAAGPNGISTEDLLVRMYADDEMPTPGGFTVLRVSICEINKVLRATGQKVINAYRGCYRLIATEEIKREAQSQAEVHPTADPETRYGHSSA